MDHDAKLYDKSGLQRKLRRLFRGFAKEYAALGLSADSAFGVELYLYALFKARKGAPLTAEETELCAPCCAARQSTVWPGRGRRGGRQSVKPRGLAPMRPKRSKNKTPGEVAVRQPNHMCRRRRHSRTAFEPRPTRRVRCRKPSTQIRERLPVQKSDVAKTARDATQNPKAANEADLHARSRCTAAQARRETRRL